MILVPSDERDLLSVLLESSDVGDYRRWLRHVLSQPATTERDRLLVDCAIGIAVRQQSSENDTSDVLYLLEGSAITSSISDPATRYIFEQVRQWLLLKPLPEVDELPLKASCDSWFVNRTILASADRQILMPALQTQAREICFDLNRCRFARAARGLIPLNAALATGDELVGPHIRRFLEQATGYLYAIAKLTGDLALRWELRLLEYYVLSG